MDDPDGDPSKTQFMLRRAFDRLLSGVARDVRRQSGDRWGGVDLISELDAGVRGHIIRRVEELGIARNGTR